MKQSALHITFKEISKSPLEYIVLALILLVGAGLFLLANFDPHGKRRILYGLAAVYMFWSIFHHYKRGDLELSIVIEYLLVALLGVILLSTTIF